MCSHWPEPELSKSCGPNLGSMSTSRCQKVLVSCTFVGPSFVNVFIERFSDPCIQWSNTLVVPTSHALERDQLLSTWLLLHKHPIWGLGPVNKNDHLHIVIFPSLMRYCNRVACYWVCGKHQCYDVLTPLSRCRINRFSCIYKWWMASVSSINIV